MPQQEVVNLTLVPVATGLDIRPPEPVAGSSSCSTTAPAIRNAVQ